MSLRLALAGALLVLVAGPAQAASGLEKCRQLEQEFDYKGMLTECGVAAAEPHATPQERIELYRLLGIAHATLGEDDKAKLWFLKLLALKPDFTLPADASPKFRETFAEAQEAFRQEGAVVVVHAPSGVDAAGRPKPVVFEVTDRLGRVGQAKVRVQSIVDGKESVPAEAALLRSGGAGATSTYSGELPDPALSAPGTPPSYVLRYDLVLQSPSGDAVQPTEPFAPVEVAVRGPAGGGGGGEVPWLGIGAVTAGAVLVVGATTGAGLAWCFTYGPCREQELRISWVKVTIPRGGAQGAAE